MARRGSGSRQAPVRLSLHAPLPGLAESPLQIHLSGHVQGERMDWAIRKPWAGCQPHHPLFTERCSTSAGRAGGQAPAALATDRHRACEQVAAGCRIAAPMALSDWLTELTQKLVLHHLPIRITQPAPRQSRPADRPGGRPECHRDRAGSGGRLPCRALRPRVLRTETAPVVALSIASNRATSMDSLGLLFQGA